MLLKRCFSALIALGTAFLPLVASWLLLDAVVRGRQAAMHNPLAPNPMPFPRPLLGPIDALVYVDPYFAGTIFLYWLLPGSLLLVGLALWATGAPLLRKEVSFAPACPGVGKLIAVSALLGGLLAVPWLLALVRVVAGGGL